jgi:hypothetical protein
VLALRGRIRDVPWYSFFSWGWKEPLEWARAFWYEGREYQAPTAMVDLAKPAFKLGVAALQVGLAAHELQVEVQPDQPSTRCAARRRCAQGHAGRAAGAGAESPCRGRRRPAGAARQRQLGLAGRHAAAARLGRATATAQSEIIGRRHYGRKAVAAGGGGGRGATRELFDTLLLWQPRWRWTRAARR